MSMEKYGVSDLVELQREELERAKIRLSGLTAVHEKTASQTQEIQRLELRVGELEVAIRSQTMERPDQ